MTAIKSGQSLRKQAETSLLKFPTDFPIKIIGTNAPDFRQTVYKAISAVLPNFSSESLKEEFSKTHKYISLTAALYVHSQVELDAVYRSVTTLPQVKFVL